MAKQNNIYRKKYEEKRNMVGAAIIWFVHFIVTIQYAGEKSNEEIDFGRLKY